MKITVWLLGFFGQLHGELSSKRNPKIADNWNRLFRIHCRKVINSDNSYSIKSICVILLIVFGFQSIISVLIIYIAGEDNIYYHLLVAEAAPLFFILWFGNDSHPEFIQHSIKISQSFAKTGYKLLILYNLIMIVIVLSLSSLTWRLFFYWNLIFVGSYLSIVLTLYVIFKLLPHSISWILSIGYQKLIRHCYENYFDNPLSNFLRFCSKLVFTLGTIKILIVFFREVLNK